jgi:hypothetical protein
VRRPSVDERLHRRLHPSLLLGDPPDGKFTISGLDPGTYEITAWHERLGTQTASVTVGAKDTKTQDFTFSTPAK